MHRLLILSVMVFLFVGGLVAPAFATEYCAPVTVATNQWCDCTVRNYATVDDTGITITIYIDNAVANTCGPLTILAEDLYICAAKSTGSAVCSCKVTGEKASLTRSSLCVDPGDYTPLTCVSCK